MSPALKYVVRNVLTRPLVSGLVVLVMFVVGATVGAVSAIGFGMLRTLQSGGHDSWVLVFSRSARLEKDSTLKVEDLGKITSAPEITRSSPENVAISFVTIGNTVEVWPLRGLEPQGFALHDVEVIEGTMPQPQRHEFLVGETLRTHMPWLRPGVTVTLIGTPFTCVGVFRAPGFISGELLTTRATYLAHPDWAHLSVVYLETHDSIQADALVNKLSNDRSLRVRAVRAPEFYGAMVRQFSYLTDGILLIFVIVVVGAVLAASSLLSVLQQRRLSELCALRAMGFRTVAVAQLIIYETELLALCGGTLGIVCAWVGLRHYVLSTLGPSLATLVFTAPLGPLLALGTLILLAVVGVLGSFIPIVRLLRTDVASGLRVD